jgi:hypothetical protein
MNLSKQKIRFGVIRSLGVKPGISLLSKNVKVTKTKQISGFNKLLVNGRKKAKPRQPRKAGLSLTNIILNEAIAAHIGLLPLISKKVRDLKSGGYNFNRDKPLKVLRFTLASPNHPTNCFSIKLWPKI